MPGSLNLTIGSNTVTLPLKLTNAQLNGLVRRFATRRGIDTTGKTATEIGEAVLRDVARFMRSVASDQDRQEKAQVAQAAVEVQILADNDLFDDPVAPAP